MVIQAMIRWSFIFFKIKNHSFIYQLSFYCPSSVCCPWRMLLISSWKILNILMMLSGYSALPSLVRSFDIDGSCAWFYSWRCVFFSSCLMISYISFLISVWTFFETMRGGLWTVIALLNYILSSFILFKATQLWRMIQWSQLSSLMIDLFKRWT